MKRKNVSKALALMLATVTCLSACGNPDAGKNNEETSSKTTESVAVSETATEVTEEAKPMYPLEGNPTFTVALQERAAVVSQFPDYNEVPWINAWEEATGVTLKIEQYSTKAMNLMFASGELPDIILYHWNSYSGGISKAVRDGLVVPITDYLEYAPDLKAIMDNDEVVRKGNTTPEGEIIGFPSIIQDEYLLKLNGMIIRQEYLDQVGMEAPDTLDEMYEVLKAFKDKLGIEAPLGVTSSQVLDNLLGYGLWTSAFGFVKGNEYVKDGEVRYGYYSDFEQYKEAVAFFRKLYEEKLLDNNFAVNPDTAANFMNGISGAGFFAGASGLNKLLVTMKDDPNFSFVAIPSLVAKEGDEKLSGSWSDGMGNYYAIITSACKDVENAVKFLNYGYTEEGHMLFNFGIEGVTYEMVDGYPTYTEYITNNPNGLTMQQAMVPYIPKAQQGAPGNQDRRYYEQYAGFPEQQEALKIWGENKAADYAMPPAITIAEANVAEYSSLNSDISTYVKETVIKCISGQISMEDFEKDFIATLDQMNMKRLIEIRQAAYDEWLDR